MTDEEQSQDETNQQDTEEPSREEALQQLFEKHQKEIKRLKDKNLLINITDEIHKEGLVDEELGILILINKICLRLVKNYSATSSNILISDRTGSGKDFLASCVGKTILPPGKYHHRTDISEKAFDYWKPILAMKPNPSGKGKKIPVFDSWNGHVIHLEDPREDALKGQSFKVMASGGTHVTKVINLKPVTIQIDGKPVMIVTSLNASIDEEGQRRWDSLRIDTSRELTKQVKKNYLERATGKKDTDKDIFLRYAVQKLLLPKEVVIPFAPFLMEYIPDNLMMRTQIKKLLDYIKASAVLHQHQRETDEKGWLIATWFDYDYARLVFISLKDFQGLTLNVAEEEFIKCLMEQNRPITISEAEQYFKKRSKTWIYNHLDEFVSKGLIDVIYEQDNLNRNIKKIYASEKKKQNHTLPSSQWFLTHFKSLVETQQQKNFKSFKRFYHILKELDEKRKKIGLPPVFQSWYSQSGETVETLETSEGNKFQPESKNSIETQESTHEKILNLKNTIERNRAANYKITDRFLSKNFDQSLIEHCKKQGLLIKRPDEEYEFNYK